MITIINIIIPKICPLAAPPQPPPLPPPPPQKKKYKAKTLILVCIKTNRSSKPVSKVLF